MNSLDVIAYLRSAITFDCINLWQKNHLFLATMTNEDNISLETSLGGDHVWGTKGEHLRYN